MPRSRRSRTIVTRDESGDLVPADQLEEGHADGNQAGCFSCFVPASKKQAVTYVGLGSGDYIVEEKYRYIGKGAGDHRLQEGDFSSDDEPRRHPGGSGGCGCCCCAGLLLLAVFAIFAALFLPEAVCGAVGHLRDAGIPVPDKVLDLGFHIETENVKLPLICPTDAEDSDEDGNATEENSTSLASVTKKETTEAPGTEPPAEDHEAEPAVGREALATSVAEASDSTEAEPPAHDGDLEEKESALKAVMAKMEDNAQVEAV